MSVDVSKIRVGDEVTIRATVTSVGDDFVRATTGQRDQWAVLGGSIATHTPAPREIAVGDKVTTYGEEYTIFTLVAVSGQRAWVRRTEDDQRLVPVAVLRHAK